jgi:hypothetical protein
MSARPGLAPSLPPSWLDRFSPKAKPTARRWTPGRPMLLVGALVVLAFIVLALLILVPGEYGVPG